MKSILFKTSVLFVFGLSLSYGQGKYSEGKKDKLTLELEREYYEEYERGMKLAAEKGWEIEFTDKYGANHALQGATEEGFPIYAKTHNNNTGASSAITIGVSRMQPGGDLGLNLTGLDMAIGHWDENHPRMSHQDFAGGRIGIMDSQSASTSQHSTHVLGTMLGSGASNPGARGMAYQAYGWINSWDNDMAEMNMLAGNNLLVSNHSYTIYINIGEALYGSYVERSRRIDEITYNNPYYQPVFAAGNDRNNVPANNPSKGGYDLLHTEATAKNVLVVAAVNGVASYTGPGSVTMSAFSNYGPTDDFRIKPDIAAKGVNVLSSTSTSDTSSGTMSGTSMAAPSVTGAIALLQQHYNSLGLAPAGASLPYMKSATVRGLIAHTAREAGNAPGPDPRFGWGLLNAGGAAEVITNSQGATTILEEKTLNNSQVFTQAVEVDGNEPLVVTVSWTDRQGMITASPQNPAVDNPSPRLINDLDLRVFKDGVEYFPWVFTKSFNPNAIKADNDVDNIEKVEIDNPTAGVYTIQVSHKGGLLSGKQDYSIIATGITNYSSVNHLDENSFVVWPNPAQDVINVDYSGVLNQDFKVEMYDLLGKRILQAELRGGNTSIDVREINKGIYLLKVGNDVEGHFIKKVVIK